jgi:hypothetical protein
MAEFELRIETDAEQKLARLKLFAGFRSGFPGTVYYFLFPISYFRGQYFGDSISVFPGTVYLSHPHDVDEN